MKRVSFEIAKVLRDKGYPQHCNVHIPYYDSDGQYHYGSQMGAPRDAFIEENTIYAPPYFDVMCWLMDTHNIYVSVQKISKDSQSCCYIYHDSNCEYEYFDDWDEAFEWGIKQAIKKL